MPAFPGKAAGAYLCVNTRLSINFDSQRIVHIPIKIIMKFKNESDFGLEKPLKAFLYSTSRFIIY